jgi:hypothetical protein
MEMTRETQSSVSRHVAHRIGPGFETSGHIAPIPRHYRRNPPTTETDTVWPASRKCSRAKLCLSSDERFRGGRFWGVLRAALFCAGLLRCTPKPRSSIPTNSFFSGTVMTRLKFSGRSANTAFSLSSHSREARAGWPSICRTKPRAEVKSGKDR